MCSYKLCKIHRKHICQTFFLTKLQIFNLPHFKAEILTQMPSWEFYKFFKNIYFLEHPLVAFSVFCIFFCSLIKKAFRIDSPVFRKLYLQTQSLYHLVFAVTISTLLSKKVKIPSIPSPVWSSLKTLWKIYSLGKRPTYYF